MSFESTLKKKYLVYDVQKLLDISICALFAMKNKNMKNTNLYYNISLILLFFF